MIVQCSLVFRRRFWIQCVILMKYFSIHSHQSLLPSPVGRGGGPPLGGSWHVTDAQQYGRSESERFPYKIFLLISRQLCIAFRSLRDFIYESLKHQKKLEGFLKLWQDTHLPRRISFPLWPLNWKVRFRMLVQMCHGAFGTPSPSITDWRVHMSLLTDLAHTWRGRNDLNWSSAYLTWKILREKMILDL